MNSYGVIEMPVISLLAGLMILAGFMEELGAFGSIARFIQHPCRSCRCCLSSDTAGGVTVGMRRADTNQVWKNSLVGGVLTAMTALFLLGPTLGNLDVGGVAFMIGLCCLVGLGIWSARSEAAEMASAAELGSTAPDLDSIKRVTERFKESVGVRDLSSANPTEDLAGGRKSTLVMICLVSALLSAVIMNDTVCLVFAPMIVSKIQGVGDRFPYLYASHTHDIA